MDIGRGWGSSGSIERDFLVERAESLHLGFDFIEAGLKLTIQLLLRDDVVGSY